MRSIEEILKDANGKGLWVANLFQLINEVGSTSVPSRPTGEWQANFRHATGWYDYGRGMGAVEALEAALDRCKGAKGPDNRPIPKTIKTVEEVLELDDLI